MFISITVQPYLRVQPQLKKSSQLAFLTFSAEPERRESLRPASLLSVHLV